MSSGEASFAARATGDVAVMNFLLGEAAQGREGRSAARCQPMDAAARLKSCHMAMPGGLCRTSLKRHLTDWHVPRGAAMDGRNASIVPASRRLAQEAERRGAPRGRRGPLSGRFPIRRDPAQAMLRRGLRPFPLLWSNGRQTKQGCFAACRRPVNDASGCAAARLRESLRTRSG
ncbi:hypothetical protein Bpla01_44650 [Burkholderia plantarii]|nr:hypothetical protein Bpla01_44650 [Burkholderia plantarii]